jgi:hypothetical protein
MRLRMNDPEMLVDALDHFSRAGFAVRRVANNALEVTRPDAPSGEQERREIELHLRVWRAMHPGRRIELG